MRWLGAAGRAHEIASAYARKREVFGAALGNHEGVGFMLADNEMDIRTARLAIWHTAWVLNQGDAAGTESSIAKVVCSEAIWRVADRWCRSWAARASPARHWWSASSANCAASASQRWLHPKSTAASLARKVMREGPNW